MRRRRQVRWRIAILSPVLVDGDRHQRIGNLEVIGAAVVVGFTGSAWPDLLVVALMASLFLHSATQIVRQAWRERNSGH